MKFLVSMMLVALVIAFTVRAQVSGQGSAATSHFEKDGLAFDFPADWKLTDWSEGDLQRVSVYAADGDAGIAVTATFGGGELCDFQTAGLSTIDNWLLSIGPKLGAARPFQTTPVKTHVGVQEIQGLQIRGVRNNHPVSCDVYWLKLNLHLLTLVYLRADNDPRGEAAWESLRATLRHGTPILDAAAAHAGVANSNVMNGRALHLTQPAYPPAARMAHASGVVVIQIVIDEDGNVASAQAITGHPLLQPASVEAAKASKFSPSKVCGEPVRITGVIQYNFVAQ
jgi:TonB family protein